MNEIILQTYDLSKSFGSVAAVQNVNLQVQQGEVFGFLGPNGAGKTTTIGMLLSLIHPTNGRIELFGQSLSPAQNRSLRRVGSLVGAPALVPYLSGRRNLQLLTRLHAGVGEERITAVLEQVDMIDAARRPVAKYSTGMKQRLGLAAALLHEPELVILDEPINGLDPAGMREIRNLIRRLVDDGVTVFLSSHLLHEVEQVCDRIAVINRGQIVAQGTVADLQQGRQWVKLRVAAPARAAEVLRSLPEAGKIEVNGAYVYVEGVTGETAVAHLADHGIIPGEVSTQQSDLETLFLELTQV